MSSAFSSFAVNFEILSGALRSCPRARSCLPRFPRSHVMHSKKKLPYDPGTLPPDKRFRANLSDLFLSGDLAAQRAHSLFADANAAGTHHVTDLAGNKRPDGNSARDLLRRLRKSSHWPPLYWADIPVWASGIRHRHPAATKKVSTLHFMRFRVTDPLLQFPVAPVASL